VFTVGAAQDRVTEAAVCDAGAVTAILKAAKDAVAAPSVAVMTMLPLVPTSLVVGVPEIAPVAELMVAQTGKPLAEKVAVPPVVDTVGWNA
jgi:hypothetical protein